MLINYHAHSFFSHFRSFAINMFCYCKTGAFPNSFGAVRAKNWALVDGEGRWRGVLLFAGAPGSVPENFQI